MTALSARDQNMLLIAGAVLLYAIAGLVYKNARANWTIARRQYETQQKKYNEECALINARNDWNARYSRLRELMPVFPPDQDVATYWQRVLNNAATENNLTIPRQMTGKEKEVGDVFELPLECKEWEGSLESLVKFLYALNKAGAMLDVRQLSLRATNRQGILKGSFTLTCAYMRGADANAGNVPAESDPGAKNEVEEPAAAKAENPEAAQEMPPISPHAATNVHTVHVQTAAPAAKSTLTPTNQSPVLHATKPATSPAIKPTMKPMLPPAAKPAAAKAATTNSALPR